MNDTTIPACAGTRIYESPTAFTSDAKTMRIYHCSPNRVAVQVRSRNSIAKSGGIRRSMIAHAELNPPQLVALRDAINATLAQYGWTGQPHWEMSVMDGVEWLETAKHKYVVKPIDSRNMECGFRVERDGVEIAGPSSVAAPPGFKTMGAAQNYVATLLAGE